MITEVKRFSVHPAGTEPLRGVSGSGLKNANGSIVYSLTKPISVKTWRSPFTGIKYPVLDSDVCRELLQGFEGTTHGLDILRHYVSIYFGGLHIGMSHEFLDDTNVYHVFEQMGGPAPREAG